LGEKQKVLITEESHDGVHFVAHNKSYDQVKLLQTLCSVYKQKETEDEDKGEQLCRCWTAVLTCPDSSNKDVSLG
jgi:hypothetical protein